MDVTMQDIKNVKVKRYVGSGIAGVFYTVDILDSKDGRITLYSDKFDEFVNMFLECAKELKRLEAEAKKKEVEG